MLSRLNLFCTFTHRSGKVFFWLNLFYTFTLLHTAMEKYFSGWIRFALLHFYSLIRFFSNLFNPFIHCSEKLFSDMILICIFTLLHTALETFFFWSSVYKCEIYSDRKILAEKDILWSWFILDFYRLRWKSFFSLWMYFEILHFYTLLWKSIFTIRIRFTLLHFKILLW